MLPYFLCYLFEWKAFMRTIHKGKIKKVLIFSSIHCNIFQLLYNIVKYIETVKKNNNKGTTKVR